jgi:hypothetical protein
MAAALPFIQTAATVLGAGAAVKAAITKPPKAPGAKPMPAQDDDAIMAARRRQIAEMQARGGRASTILSQDETLG